MGKLLLLVKRSFSGIRETLWHGQAPIKRTVGAARTRKVGGLSSAGFYNAVWGFGKCAGQDCRVALLDNMELRQEGKMR